MGQRCNFWDIRQGCLEPAIRVIINITINEGSSDV